VEETSATDNFVPWSDEAVASHNRGMANESDDALMEVRRRADACANRLFGIAPATDGIAASATDWTALLDAIRTLHPRYAFEAEGRPSALEAVRHALPSMERDLFDAIVEDYGCEIAALREAAYQLVRALERSQRPRQR